MTSLTAKFGVAAIGSAGTLLSAWYIAAHPAAPAPMLAMAAVAVVANVCVIAFALWPRRA